MEAKRLISGGRVSKGRMSMRVVWPLELVDFRVVVDVDRDVDVDEDVVMF